MLIIGLTGSLGTGKSFVASIFRSLGAKVIDADALAHKAIERGSPAYKSIVSLFGKGVLSKDKNISRRILASCVFSDRKKLNKLNAIVHPVVISKIKAAIKKASDKDVVVIDAPLLIEANLAGLVDRLVVVKASQSVQIKRACQKLKIEKGECLNRIRRQIPLSRKVRMADFIIDNNGDRKTTGKQVIEIWRKMVWR